MRKIFLILVIGLVSCDCGNPKIYQLDDKVQGHNVEVITIDSCEYIRIYNGNATWGSHKGNCKFCKERSK